jgi:hypothetical protein
MGCFAASHRERLYGTDPPQRETGGDCEVNGHLGYNPLAVKPQPLEFDHEP